MYYEVYIDSLFLLQFFLNLYLLGLVNRMLYHAASGKRVLGGAVLGAVCSLVPFLLPIKLSYGMLCSFLMSILSMSLFVFRTFRLAQLLKVLEKMLVMTLLLGGMLLFLLKLLPDTEGAFWGLIGVLALGAVSYTVVGRLMGAGKETDSVCQVTLEGHRGKVQIEALIDTGNSLIEPISGKPVAVIEEATFQMLFGEATPELYRAIPYHSVGKSNGILKGYLLEYMVVELQGVKKECNQIYVAVSQELLAEKSNYRMILNPRMLEK